jgi:hypothetical protein
MWYDQRLGGLGELRPPGFLFFCLPSQICCMAQGTRMAQTEHLPIYKSTYDLCLNLEQVVQHFSRYHSVHLMSPVSLCVSPGAVHTPGVRNCVFDL